MNLPFSSALTEALPFAATEFSPALYPRARFDAQYPALAALHADVQGMSSDTGKVPQAMCAMTQRRHFAPLIGEPRSTAPVLVFFLPQAFERFLPQLAMAQILVHNWTALDLSQHMTYCSWYAKEGEESAKEATSWGIWLPAHVYRAYEQQSAAQSFDLLALNDEQGAFHPIIWVAGEAVAVGRFWVDVWLHVQISVTEEVARGHDPKWQATAKEQDEAIGHAANPTPWRHQMHTLASNNMWPRQHVIEPAAYDGMSWQP